MSVQVPTALRVATIPAADPYVDAVLPPGAVRVPGPDGSPAAWLDGEQVAAHAGDLDVVHLHVGYGHLAATELECWTETLRRLGVPLVVTVHQLLDADPATRERTAANLAAVLDTAEVVLTLTPGAADEIAERFGRTAIVVAHPTLTGPASAVGGERGVVGVVLGGLPTGLLEPTAVVRAALSGAVSGGGSLRVLAEPDGVPPAVRALAERGDVELVEVCRASADWPAALQGLHVAVLAERCGSHSRDLEVCRDVGTRVVAPSCGWFAEQWADVVSYGNDEAEGLDAVSLTAAVAAALARPAPRPADRGWRADQLRAVRQVHAEVYAQVAADRWG